MLERSLELCRGEIRECNRITERDRGKLEQIKVEREGANGYLNKKILDNYEVIGGLEERIEREQEERRLALSNLLYPILAFA